MSKLIAFFEYDGIRYFISLLKNKRILFLKCNKNNKFSTNLSNKELKMVNKIYKSLIINPEKSSYIKEINLGNSIYNIFFDSTSHNYFWIPDNGTYDNNDNIYLNFRYNHKPSTVFVESFNESQFKSSKFYTKFTKIGSKLFPILISATLSLTLLSGSTIIKQEEIRLAEETIGQTQTQEIITNETIEIEETTEVTEAKREYDYEEIRQAIEKNPNIGEAEKDFLYKLKFLFDENHRYMDLDLIIDRLAKLEISYNMNLQSAQACYIIPLNKICMESGDFDSTNKATFLHEFLHVLQNGSNSFTGEISTEFFAMETMIRLYKEGIFEKEFFLSQYARKQLENGELVLNNEIEWLEYLNKNSRFSSGYKGYVNLYSVLAELLPQSALRNYQFNPDFIEILVEPLTRLDKSSDNEFKRAYQLIDSIDGIRMYSPETDSYTYSKDISNCYEELNYYFRQKKGISLNEDIEYTLCLELETRLNDNLESNIWDYMNDNYNVLKATTMVPKTHLSDAQKEPTLIFYNGEEQLNILEINEEVKTEYIEYTSYNISTNTINKSK